MTVEPAQTAKGGVAVVFGASGGIGAAVAAQLGKDTRFAQVLEFSRSGPLRADLDDEASLAQAAAQAAQAGDMRLVIDATGFLSDETQGPEKSWRDLRPETLARAFAINAIGPALLMKHVLPLLPRAGPAVFATLSARVGSIGDNHLGGWYGYRASKAALNQLVRTAAIELRRTHPEAACVALHPGTVATRLSAGFAKNGLEVQTPQAAAERILAVLAHLGPQQSGSFVDHRGQTIAW
jgi:NAD(P)-dependent dehydrogenase (short-subunit alcohol dehydrogenase family)